MTAVSPLHRTLEQELLALLRGASLECPVCGEFVLHDGPSVHCPECGMRLHGRSENAGIQVELDLQAG
jgi:rubrerythrin